MPNSTDLEPYKKLLKEDPDLVDHIIEKGGELQWFYERFLYFTGCAGEACKYADACVKMMREDIDEFYSRREANNAA